MKKLFTSLCLMAFGLTATAQYQIHNGSFEQWDNEGTKNVEPTQWNSFMSGTGNLKSMAAAQQVEKSSDAHSGSASVRIYARSVFGVIAQGNLTTGCINMGAMSATDATGNYNYTKTDDEDFYEAFTGLPDAMSLWVKASCQYGGAASCTLHTEGYFQDPQANDVTAQVVAQAINTSIESSSTWQQVTIPFKYKMTNGTRPSYALVSLMTSGTPGQGSEQDNMLVDDVEFIYYSELASATFFGRAIEFTGTQATVSGTYDASQLKLKSNGQGASIESSYDEATRTLTVTILGDDISINPTNKHTYTLRFTGEANPEAQPDTNADIIACPMPNGTFETWKSACGKTLQEDKGEYTRPGSEPEEWNGSSVNQRVTFIWDRTIEKELIRTTTGADGSTAVSMTNETAKAGGISWNYNAPAYITLGTPWIHCEITTSEVDGGTFGGTPYTLRPDALRGQFRRTTGANGEEEAHIIAYLWKGTFNSPIGKKSNPSTTTDDVDRAILGKVESQGDGQLIASCDHAFTATTNDGWQTILVPLTYVPGREATAPEKMNVIISSADYWNRSNIKTGNTLDVDNLEWVFYSELATATYEGTDIEFTNGMATVDAFYDESQLSLSVTGRSATVSTYFDEESCVLTINVQGGDYSVNPRNTHTYTVQFKVPEPYNPVVGEQDYTDMLQVTINGYSTEPQQATVTLQAIDDGTYTFILRNFILGTDTPVGTIVIDNLTIEPDGTFNVTRNLQIIAGDTPANAQWLGPVLGIVPIEMEGQLTATELLAHIQIDLTAKMGQAIDVKFGQTLIDQGEEPEPVNPGETIKLEGTHTYTDNLVVTLNGNSFPSQQTDITVTFNTGGTLDLSLRNFSLPQGDDVMYVGNVELHSVPYTLKGGSPYATFRRSENVNITAGDTPADANWAGPLLGPIPVALSGKVGTEKLYCTINIELGGIGSIRVLFGDDKGWPEVGPGEPVDDPILRDFTYTDQLRVTVNGHGNQPQEAKVLMEVNDDETINLTLKNFWLQTSETESAPVGNIRLTGIQPIEVKDQNQYLFETQQNITIQEGDPIEGVLWTGPYFGEIPVTMSGKIARWKMYANISIYMAALGENISVVFGEYFTDSINKIMQSHPAAGSVFTLGGVRVEQVQKGSIYIVNGRKVLQH